MTGIDIKGRLNTVLIDGHWTNGPWIDQYLFNAIVEKSKNMCRSNKGLSHKLLLAYTNLTYRLLISP